MTFQCRNCVPQTPVKHKVQDALHRIQPKAQRGPAEITSDSNEFRTVSDIDSECVVPKPWRRRLLREHRTGAGPLEHRIELSASPTHLQKSSPELKFFPTEKNDTLHTRWQCQSQCTPLTPPASDDRTAGELHRPSNGNSVADGSSSGAIAAAAAAVRSHRVRRRLPPCAVRYACYVASTASTLFVGRRWANWQAEAPRSRRGLGWRTGATRPPTTSGRCCPSWRCPTAPTRTSFLRSSNPCVCMCADVVCASPAAAPSRTTPTLRSGTRRRRAGRLPRSLASRVRGRSMRLSWRTNRLM